MPKPFQGQPFRKKGLWVALLTTCDTYFIQLPNLRNSSHLPSGEFTGAGSNLYIQITSGIKKMKIKYTNSFEAYLLGTGRVGERKEDKKTFEYG